MKCRVIAKNRKSQYQTGLLLLGAVLLVSCSGPPAPAPYELSPQGAYRGVGGVEVFGEKLIDKSLHDSRRIIQNAEIVLKADSTELVQEQILEIMKATEGYMVRTERNLTIIRVPALKFVETLEQVRQLGEVLDELTYGEDVTEQFRDLEVRLDNALKTRDRYLALLDKANSVNEMLEVERELERLNELIEMLKGTKQNLTHLASFATIKVSTKAPIKRGILGELGYGIYKGVSWLFVRH